MPEKPSAGGLLGSLKKTFGLNWEKPVGVPVAAETPVSPVTAAPEAEQTVVPEPTVTEEPAAPAVSIPAAAKAEMIVVDEDEFPDWLSAPTAVEPTPTPPPESAVAPVATPDWLRDGKAAAVAPAPEAPASLPVEPTAEAPAVPSAAEAEKSPERLAIEKFEEALIAADNALGRLRAGETLDNNQLRAAMAAAATANGLIRNLPERYLKVLLASRRLGENRDYNRLDFQKDMMGAIRAFSQANKG